MSSASAAHTNPTVGQIVDGLSATEHHNEGSRLKSAGDLEGAERMYLQAIEEKEASLGTDHFVTATSYDGLGEVYLAMQRPAQAEECFNKALRVRERSGFACDLAMTRDNLGQVYEMKGDLQAAQEMRLRGAADSNIACGNYNCLKLQNNLSDLSRCSVCKAVFYCSRPCQASDWKRHKKYCRPVA